MTEQNIWMSMKVTSDIAAAEAVLLTTAAENAKFDILGWIKNKIHMTITEKEIREDFARFIRHEAMRANTTQDEILKVLTGGVLGFKWVENEYPIKVISGRVHHTEGDKFIYEWAILSDQWLWEQKYIRIKF